VARIFLGSTGAGMKKLLLAFLFFPSLAWAQVAPQSANQFWATPLNSSGYFATRPFALPDLLQGASCFSTNFIIDNGGNVGCTGQILVSQLPSTIPTSNLAFTLPLSLANGGTGSTAPTEAATHGVAATGSFPNHQFSMAAGAAANGTLFTCGPTGSTSVIMCGYGSTAKLTPTRTGVMVITIQGLMQNNTASNGCYEQMNWGTGTKPSGGASNTGTQATAGRTTVQVGGGGTFLLYPFTETAVISTTIGTPIWFDIAMATGNGSTTCTITSSFMAAYEL
jgi:hypothetical protein